MVSTPTPFPLADRPPRLVTLIAFAALGASAMNIFLPSLTVMADWFDTSYATMQLSISLYLVISGVLQLFIGPLSDRFGRRPVAFAILTIFLLATLGALFAPNIEIFLICRLLQAVIATSLSLSRAIVKDIASQAEAVSMLGWLAMGFALVPMLFPAIGGMLEQRFGWQATFVLLLGFGIAVFVLVWFGLGETSKTQHGSLFAQIKCYPDLLRSRSFWAYAMGGALSSGVIYCHIGAAPALGEQAFGLGSAGLGAYIGMTSIGYILGSLIAARLSRHVAMRKMMFLGGYLTLGVVACMLALELSGVQHPALYFGGVALLCTASGILLPAANVGMMSVRADLIGSASGLGSALMIGVGALLSIVTAQFAAGVDSIIVIEAVMAAVAIAALVVVHLFARAD